MLQRSVRICVTICDEDLWWRTARICVTYPDMFHISSQFFFRISVHLAFPLWGFPSKSYGLSLQLAPHTGKLCTGWRRLIGCLKLQVSFRKRATNHRALLRKMAYEEKASYDPMPPCRESLSSEFFYLSLHSFPWTSLLTHTHWTAWRLKGECPKLQRAALWSICPSLQMFLTGSWGALCRGTSPWKLAAVLPVRELPRSTWMTSAGKQICA